MYRQIVKLASKRIIFGRRLSISIYIFLFFVANNKINRRTLKIAYFSCLVVVVFLGIFCSIFFVISISSWVDRRSIAFFEGDI